MGYNQSVNKRTSSVAETWRPSTINQTQKESSMDRMRPPNGHERPERHGTDDSKPLVAEEIGGLRPDYWSRRDEFRGQLNQQSIENAIILNPQSIAYYTGNTIPTEAALIHTSSGWSILSPEYDAYNFEKAAPDLEVHTYPYHEPFVTALEGALADIENPVGMELSGLSASGLRELESSSGIRPMDCGDLIAGQRAVKDAWEMSRIRNASSITGQVYAEISEFVSETRRESEIAAFIYDRLLDMGSEHMASQPYVKSGERALLTHARWSSRVVDPSDHLLLEFGACVDRYHAPLMRTRLGSNQSALYESARQAVLEARDAVLGALRPGASSREIYRAYIGPLQRHHVAEMNRHALGYSIGPAFPPTWAEPSVFWIDGEREGELLEGMVLHLVPGVVDPEQGVEHIGMSELVAITADGAERLVTAPDFL